MFDQIEKLKSEFTDKFVVVQGGRPELSRFQGKTGQIKTVNMSGRALVQFDGDNNIGWFDIGLDFLKVVPKPEPKEDEKHAKSKGAKPQTSADGPAAAPKPAAATGEKPAGEKKPSVAEMLRAQAAAKAAGGAAAPAKPQPAAPTKAEPAPAPVAKAEAPAAKKPDPAPAVAAEPAKAAGEKKLTTAEILAQLRKKA